MDGEGTKKQDIKSEWLELFYRNKVAFFVNGPYAVVLFSDEDQPHIYNVSVADGFQNLRPLLEVPEDQFPDEMFCYE